PLELLSGASVAPDNSERRRWRFGFVGDCSATDCCRLTVKLRGRARRQAALRSNEVLKAPRKRPEGRRGRTLSPGARGAKQTTHHGPLQRLLGVTSYPHRLRLPDSRC